MSNAVECFDDGPTFSKQKVDYTQEIPIFWTLVNHIQKYRKSILMQWWWLTRNATKCHKSKQRTCSWSIWPTRNALKAPSVSVPFTNDDCSALIKRLLHKETPYILQLHCFFHSFRCTIAYRLSISSNEYSSPSISARELCKKTSNVHILIFALKFTVKFCLLGGKLLEFSFRNKKNYSILYCLREYCLGTNVLQLKNLQCLVTETEEQARSVWSYSDISIGQQSVDKHTDHRGQPEAQRKQHQ